MDRLDRGIAKSSMEHVKNMYEDGLKPEEIARYLRLDTGT